MIVGLGLDAAEIARFDLWTSYSQERLLQVFSLSEIEYALGVPAKAPERLAARFAAKEAAYKALARLMPKKLNLIDFCKLVQVHNDTDGAPSLIIDLAKMGLEPGLRLSLSITHSQLLAIAVVVVESH